MADMKVTKALLEFSIKNQEPLTLWGDSGVGKTQGVRQVTTAMNRNLVELHLANQDIGDLVGIPSKCPETGKTIWSKPNWIVDKDTPITDEIDHRRPTVYFLDEFNRGHNMVLQAMLPFLLDGKIHEHSIGPEDSIIAACNFVTTKFSVNELADAALIDRAGHIICSPTVEDFRTYVDGVIDQTTMDLIHTESRMFEIEHVDFEEATGFTISPSRRKVERIMKHFRGKPDSWINGEGFQILHAYMGSEFAALWHSLWKERDRKLDPEEVFARTPETVEKIQRFIAGDDVEMGIIDAANAGCISYLKNNDMKVSSTQLDNFIKYMCELPGDCQRRYFEEVMMLLTETPKTKPTLNGMTKSEFGAYIFEFAINAGNKAMVENITKAYDY